jgi:hypothetical protein
MFALVPKFCKKKTLMKLTAGVNFTNVFCVAFTLKNPKRAKRLKTLLSFLRFWDLQV